MIPTLDLWNLVEKWADIIENSESIKTYCQEKYGKDFKLYLGADPKEPPGAENAPYIMIIPGSKTEGMNDDTFTYTNFIHVCIVKGEKTADGETIKHDTEYEKAKKFIVPGQKEIIEFSQLIYSELQANLQEHPISKLDMDVIVGTTYPQFASLMTLITDIEPAMGENLTY